ncbi:MAG TPA: LysR family transcriptional regulator [Kofleriaceae bacterium]|nr:LysR family transcriptional regulator [Kofleriaceae bacterium]
MGRTRTDKPPDLNEILIFTRVVQAGSFTAAARTLAMPKSSVSRKVSELEDRLGVRLLHRTTRKLGLTDAGRLYFERGARIVAEMEEADQAVSRMQAAPRGLLRVTAPLSFAMLGPMITEYLKRYPDVQVELLCSDRRFDLVEEGFDVAIRAGPLDDSTLIARRLGVIQRVLVASPAYLRRRRSPRSPADLAEHTCISFAADRAPSVWTLHAGERRAEVRVSPRYSVNELDLMLEAVRDGIGIAWIPEFVAIPDVRAGRLRHILREWRSSETQVHAVYPTARHLSPKVVGFVELVRERFALGGDRA